MSIEKRVHPIPFRTRKLSASSPMILRIFTWESRPMPRLSLERLLIRSLSPFKGRVVHAALLRLKAPPQRRIWKGIFRRMFFAVVFSASGRSGQRKNAFPESLRLWTKHDVGPENDGQSGDGPKGSGIVFCFMFFRNVFARGGCRGPGGNISPLSVPDPAEVCKGPAPGHGSA